MVGVGGLVDDNKGHRVSCLILSNPSLMIGANPVSLFSLNMDIQASQIYGTNPGFCCELPLVRGSCDRKQQILTLLSSHSLEFKHSLTCSTASLCRAPRSPSGRYTRSTQAQLQPRRFFTVTPGDSSRFFSATSPSRAPLSTCLACSTASPAPPAR